MFINANKFCNECNKITLCLFEEEFRGKRIIANGSKGYLVETMNVAQKVIRSSVMQIPQQTFWVERLC